MKKTLPLLVLALGTAAVPLRAQIAFTPNNTLLPGTYGNPSCVVDMNGDHLDDIVRFNGTQPTIAYQQPNGTYVHQTFANATVSPNWSICAGDLDGNGYNDILIGNGSANSFLYANSTGTGFTETYYPPYIFSQRTNMADIDNDGHLDAWSCHDVGLSKPYRNPGTGAPVVEDQTLIQQVTTVGGNYASIFVDYDNDQDLDLYITKCRSGAPLGDPQRINLLYRNNGNGTWTEVGAAAGMNDGAQSWSTVFEDFDNDGDFDAFIVNHTDANRLMRNNGDGTFTDVIAGSGVAPNLLGAWESQGADFDNDGWVDIFSEVGGGIYRNNGDWTFTNISVSPREGGIGDLNNDGWLDYHVGGTVYVNNGGSNHWIKVELQGIFSNQNGIGARLWLYGDWGTQTREIRSGQGFSHMNTLQGHFGIGQSTAIDSLVIEWPSGVRTVIEQPAIDQLHLVPEAECTLDPVTIAVNGNTSICPGGSVELSAPGGFASYQWSNGATSANIEASSGGNYTVVAFDGDGCAALSNSVSVQVIEDEAPTVALVGEDEVCEGTLVTLVSSNGNNAVWSNGATGGTIEVGESGAYTVTADGQCGGVTSEPVTVLVNPAPATPTADDVTIPAPGTATLLADGVNIQWYANETDTDPMGTGNSWETPFLNGQTTFWCEANNVYGGVEMSGGKPDNSGGGGLPSSGSHSFFDNTEPFILERVTVYAIGDGLRTVNLCDAQGNVLQSAGFDLTDGMHELELNFDVPVGSNMSLRCPQHTLFRNNSGVQYPYAIGTMGQLTGSGFGNSYYYYFYDWKVRTPQMICPSDRVPVTVNIGTVGLDEVGASDLQVYPVPATTEVRVDGVKAGETVRVFDAQGRLVLESSTPATSGSVTLPVESLNAGSYLLNVRGADRSVVRDLVIVR